MMRFSISRDWVRFGNYAVMLFGHCIIIWFPAIWYLRVGDYFCYPVFCFLAGVGIKETSSMSKYLAMMLLGAIVSQYGYELAGVGEAGHLNIMYWLACSVAVVYLCEKIKSVVPLVLGLVGSALTNNENTFYGILIMYGVVRYYEYIPKFQDSRLRMSKYFVWAIYPGHLLALGLLRNLI